MIVVILAVASFATLALTYVERSARTDLIHTIDTDIAGLTDIMVQGGPQELQRRIVDRTDFKNTGRPELFYWMGDASGQRLAGNLAAPPLLSAVKSSVIEITDKYNGPILLRLTQLRGGVTLGVGRSLVPGRVLLDDLRRSFVWLALLATALSILVGAISALRLSRRLETINSRFSNFDRGRRDERHVSATGRDEIARLSRHVDTHLARIEHLLDAQRDITDNIAHELRTPLVHLDARLLRALDISHQPDVGDMLHRARADIRLIVALFDALLDIATADADPDPRNSANIDLSELVANIADLYAASAEEAGLDFSSRITPGISIRGESTQLTRMIANLLDNAFKYVPTGSRVRLMLAEGPTIIVQDDGPGVPVEHRKTIFQRFHRGVGTEGGHGLGLALVGVIAARHGLSASVEDANPGARFIVASRGST